MWNFAYGANMSPVKLESARGLKPLESRPGALPGWRLSFTHRRAAALPRVSARRGLG